MAANTTLLRKLTGQWVDGSAPTAVPQGFNRLQLFGIWVNHAPATVVVEDEEVKSQKYARFHYREEWLTQAKMEDEEVIAIIKMLWEAL